MIHQHTFHGQQVKLGKGAVKHDDRTLKLSKYLKVSALPALPPHLGYSDLVPTWGMMLNDTLGDCTCACAGHMEEAWSKYANKEIVPTNAQVLKMYEDVGGYVPGNPNTDNGAVIIDILNYWRQTGLGGRKISAYAAINPADFQEVKYGVYLFGNVYIGVALPLSAQTQTVWAVPSGGPVGNGAPGSWGGHAIPIVEYDETGVYVVTWGMKLRMTYEFLKIYSDEAYAVLSPDWFEGTSGHPAPNGFLDGQLMQDMSAITSV